MPGATGCGRAGPDVPTPLSPVMDAPLIDNASKEPSMPTSAALTAGNSLGVGDMAWALLDAIVALVSAVTALVIASKEAPPAAVAPPPVVAPPATPAPLAGGAAVEAAADAVVEAGVTAELVCEPPDELVAAPAPPAAASRALLTCSGSKTPAPGRSKFDRSGIGVLRRAASSGSGLVNEIGR